MALTQTGFLIFITMCSAFSAMRMAGGWQEISNNRTDVQRLASLSAQNISKASNSLFHMKLLHVNNVYSQVVAGVKYRIQIELGYTECKKNTQPNVDASECEVLECEPHENCRVLIWEKLWENFTQIQDISCIRGVKKC